MTVTLEVETEVSFEFDYKALAEQVINYAMDAEEFPYEAEVSLTLVDNDSIQEINKNYRKIDRATDVLSFPMLEYEAPGDFSHIEDMEEDNFNPDTGECMLGDIIISVDKVKEQAESYGHSQMREYAFLIVHSMLHLFGYDHMEPEEAKVMEAHQTMILNGLNIVR